MATLKEPWTSGGLLVIRLALGLGIMAHGLQKFFVFGMSGFVEGLTKMGVPFPSILAPVSAGTEALGGLLIALGLVTRFAALPLAFNMFVAVWTAHRHAYFLPAGMEYALNLGLVYLALALTGPGRFSLDHLIFNRENPKGDPHA
jgi:putative oxidoreductase